MYYPIYGEYYTGSDVTVDANYVTTTETWRVAYINDRRQTPQGLECRILWVHPARSCKRLCIRTWEPSARLAEDDFEVEMDLGERWKASKFDTFEEFWKQDKMNAMAHNYNLQRLHLFDFGAVMEATTDEVKAATWAMEVGLLEKAMLCPQCAKPMCATGGAAGKPVTPTENRSNAASS
ncbi:uncharacterized protein IUM83_08939 [Phytophthora cinnamomi]|uniref:uncharacterized protein n=1 Tax=Phytophthora cinnamomi TaxID=4785 RepID=UPI00355A9DDD|nr:hypothetical protein IUM83_08939 [Phytophthora cinnamomi]